ncbi:MAG: putative transcriptional regulator, partial [Planctomycetota bacterium]
MNDRLAVPGTLLLSVPQMLDPNFMHTVVLMVQHSSTGAFGLVVNRDAVTTVKMLFPEHALLSLVNFPVHAGGPVGQDSFQFLHCVPDAIAGGIELSDGLFLGGDLDSFAEYVATEDR